MDKKFLLDDMDSELQARLYYKNMMEQCDTQEAINQFQVQAIVKMSIMIDSIISLLIEEHLNAKEK